MKNSFGNHFVVTIFGESHGQAIGVVIDGMPSGIKINEQLMSQQLFRRKAKGKISTSRVEKDEVQIVSGVFESYSTGTPITLLIKNENQQSKDYTKTKGILRPSHSDYSAMIRYLGYEDYRGGGHFSGRITAPLVAAGSIALSMLHSKNIVVGSHISQINTVVDSNFSDDDILCKQQISEIFNKEFPIINDEIKEEMISCIEQARASLDSVGGIVESKVLNMPSGVGEPFFDSLESRLSHAIFSIGGVKGIEFGLGFDFAKEKGSTCNDEFYMSDDGVRTRTNNNGGINGGISNGMPIHFKTVIKPTPSIAQSQNTVDMNTQENCELQIQGRHDPCIVHRALVVIDSVIAIVLVDCLIERFGPLWFQGEKK